MKTLILSTPLLGALPLTIGQMQVAMLSGGLPQQVPTGNHPQNSCVIFCWSPVMGVGGVGAIAPTPGEAMSLLRRPV